MESTVILNFYEIESQIVQYMNMNDVSDRLEHMRFQNSCSGLWRMKKYTHEVLSNDDIVSYLILDSMLVSKIFKIS